MSLSAQLSGHLPSTACVTEYCFQRNRKLDIKITTYFDKITNPGFGIDEDIVGESSPHQNQII